MRGGLVAGILFPMLGKTSGNAKNEKQSAQRACYPDPGALLQAGAMDRPLLHTNWPHYLTSDAFVRHAGCRVLAAGTLPVPDRRTTS